MEGLWEVLQDRLWLGVQQHEHLLGEWLGHHLLLVPHCDLVSLGNLPLVGHLLSSMSLLALAQGSIVVLATTGKADLSLCWTFIGGMGIATFGAPVESR